MGVDRQATVIFDYGEVISLAPDSTARAAIERISGVPAEVLWPAYWAERGDYDRGLAAPEYWRRVAQRCQTTWSTTQLQEIWAADVASWLHVAPTSVALIDRLATRGVELALLSNAPADIAGALRRSPIVRPFSALFFSCDIGLSKPDPAIYRHVLSELASSPSETIFVDDREDNIVTAKELGIDAHHYTDAAELESFLSDRLG
ncbi:HAD family hydrolase [Salinactinospora qingdaonensis]|uniref:HAD family phosphatase n=1 Tax=Salinactinospora qingdaonensis TaxID=702744 RepID=A0ABP7ETI4_9ACTN